MLLILAAVSLSAVFSEKGIFSRAEKAGNKYNEAKAREVLETVLLADGQYEKNSNSLYNQNEFLDNLITTAILESRIIEGTDVVVIEEKYAYELDRSVPKIGRYLGLAKDLIFPTVDATVRLADDKKTATITITASEETNGINKIEIWLLGEKIDEFPYENIKTEITLPYTATQNGKYTIKAYGDLMASKTVEVDGILASVKFEPNGNEEWKKEHSTTVTIQETADKVINAKYVWLTSVATPDDSKFSEEQTFKSGDTITGGNETMTGTYYLWTMLTTESGEKVKWRSEGFNFDNEGPTITAFTPTKYSETGITLSVTAQDSKSGIVKIEYYIDDVIQNSYTETMNATTSSITRTVNITGLSTGNHNCKVIVYDAKENYSNKSTIGKTKIFYWDKYSLNTVNVYSEATEPINSYNYKFNNQYLYGASVNRENGCFIGGLRNIWVPKNGVAHYYWNSAYYSYFWLPLCCSWSSAAYKYSGTENNEGDGVTIFKAYGSRITDTTYSKGNKYIGEVSSTESSKFPVDGHDKKYWYVRKESK